MASIDIGPGAADGNTYATPGNTRLDTDNPANDSGVLDTFEIWANTEMSNTKMGTFFEAGSVAKVYTSRDYSTLGTITAGSKQTYSGLSVDVVAGDVIGSYWSAGQLELFGYGGTQIRIKAGDHFGAESQGFADWQGTYKMALFGSGVSYCYSGFYIYSAPGPQIAAGQTWLNNNHPANESGPITEVKVRVEVIDYTAAKIGTFSGAGLNWNDRDYESVGTITSGSVQTFSGLDIDCESGDILGMYGTTGWVGLVTLTVGAGNVLWVEGDKFGAGVTAYASLTPRVMSLWGHGEPVTAPTVTTQAATDIGTTTATGNGNITDTGGENCDKRGIVYGTSTQGDPGNVAPGASGYDDFEEQIGSFGSGAFTRSLTGLTPNQLYYARAYAHNSAGYSYGSEVSFTTEGLENKSANMAAKMMAAGVL